MTSAPRPDHGIQAIVFDMTGVITSSPLDAIGAYAVSVGVRAETVLRHFRSDAFIQVLKGAKAMDVLVNDIVVDAERTDGVVLSASRLREAMRVSQQIDPDTAKLIGELSSRYRLAVLTNNTADIVDRTESGSPSWWGNDSGHALRPSDFSMVMSSSELGLVKPDIAIYRELLRRLGLEGRHVVYVDDQAANLPAAQELGMQTVHFRGPAQCRSDLHAIGIAVALVTTHSRESVMDTQISLSTLMTIRLKGRTAADAVAKATGQAAARSAAELDAGVSSGALVEANGRFRVTTEGIELLARLLEDERGTVDTVRLETLYESFDNHNSTLKQIVTEWQVRPDGTPNEHDEEAYDLRIVQRLSALHGSFAPWLDDIGQVVPRLRGYSARFGAAVEAVEAGDHSFIAQPIKDSYHTIWFELHEELIALLGRERVAEAVAGRA